jgi:hypothetical protein
LSSKKGERALLSQLKKKKGVLRLYDERKNVIFTKGAMNKQDLSDQLELFREARFIAVIEDSKFSRHASEMLQHFIVEDEKMPKVNQEMEDLF